MHSAYKLNKEGDNMQLWCTPFPIWNQSVAPCLIPNVASWPACRFLRSPVRWSAIPISWRIFNSLLWSRGTRDQIANIHWIMEKTREFQKNICFCFMTKPKPLTVWITINCGKFWKRWDYQTIWPVSWEIYMQVRKQQLELDMEQQTGSKSGKE